MNHCPRCDARLRKSKPPWALCDPCDDARHRANIAHEQAQEQARLDAGERPCNHCGQHTAAVRSGIYAWLCNTCRDQARSGGKAA